MLVSKTDNSNIILQNVSTLFGVGIIPNLDRCGMGSVSQTHSP